MRNGSVNAVTMYCSRCNATTRWLVEENGRKFTCVGDDRHPERRLPGCGKVIGLDSTTKEEIKK